MIATRDETISNKSFGYQVEWVRIIDLKFRMGLCKYIYKRESLKIRNYINDNK